MIYQAVYGDVFINGTKTGTGSFEWGPLSSYAEEYVRQNSRGESGASIAKAVLPPPANVTRVRPLHKQT